MNSTPISRLKNDYYIIETAHENCQYTIQSFIYRWFVSEKQIYIISIVIVIPFWPFRMQFVIPSREITN